MEKCKKCGAENQPGSKFCFSCGETMVSSPPPPVSQMNYPPAPPLQGPGVPPPIPGMPSPGMYPNYPSAGNPSTQGKTAKLGLERNIAGLLCYVLGWLSGVILYFVEKDHFVRFHAVQSVAVFGGIHVINLVLSIVIGSMFHALGGMISMLMGIISLVTWVLWFYLMYKAYHREYYKLPVVGDYVEQFIQKHPN